MSEQLKINKNKAIKKKLICHVVTTLGVGGMENGIVNLANNHDREKFEIAICCLNDAGDMAKRLKHDVQLHVLEEKEGFSLMRVLRVAKFFIKIQPDIVHTHAWGGGSFYGIIGAKLAGVSIVINGEHGAFFTGKAQLLMQQILFYLSNYNLSVSETLKVKAAHTLNLPKNKIMVIKNGVDTDRFNGQYPKAAVFKKIKAAGTDISNKTFNIFLIGSLKPEKAQMTALRSAKMIKDSHMAVADKLRFVFIGIGPDLKFLQDYVNQHDLNKMICFLGNRVDIPELLSVAHLLVSTSISRHEGLSNVILEAMSSGVPVIATKSVGSGEVVRDDYNGFLIKEGDVEHLSHHIIELANAGDQLERLGQNARKNIIDNFSIKKMVENYEDLYFSALKQNNFKG